MRAFKVLKEKKINKVPYELALIIQFKTVSHKKYCFNSNTFDTNCKQHSPC